jgi:hypothetical protein
MVKGDGLERVAALRSSDQRWGGDNPVGGSGQSRLGSGLVERQPLGLVEAKMLDSDYHVSGDELQQHWMIVLSHNGYII